MTQVHQLRPKPADSEKITINLGYVDLGRPLSGIKRTLTNHCSSTSIYEYTP
jgi:hypothetical protein